MYSLALDKVLIGAIAQMISSLVLLGLMIALLVITKGSKRK